MPGGLPGVIYQRTAISHELIAFLSRPRNIERFAHHCRS
jgi:hypothetical protein